MSESTAPAPANPRRINRFGPALPPRTFAGFAAAMVMVLLIAFFGYRSLDNQQESSALAAHGVNVLQRIDGLMSSLKDAETGQRGYIITGNESYLEPYQAALPEISRSLDLVKRLTADKIGRAHV